MFCQFCGEKISDKHKFCPSCGKGLNNSTSNQVNIAETIDQSNYSTFKPYYQKAFQKMDARKGKYTPYWNWASFLFGIIWYFVKGMWAKGLLFLGLLLFTNIFPDTIGWIVTFLIWLIMGFRGTYDYYRLKVIKTQLQNSRQG